MLQRPDRMSEAQTQNVKWVQLSWKNLLIFLFYKTVNRNKNQSRLNIFEYSAMELQQCLKELKSSLSTEQQVISHYSQVLKQHSKRWDATLGSNEQDWE